ncbi:MAG: glutamine--fructose-6-phosphate transaminase (isomerizing) [Candidatus Hadarchaeales archaeon]
MCGIVGYIGGRRAAPVLLKSLKRLEYRGYDSAGMATLSGKIQVKKDRGRIDEIHAKLNFEDMEGNLGISHSRWATHGAPSMENAHPHTDNAGKIAVVHNGIIENYIELKKYLTKHGYNFRSQTDTEVIPNLISHFMAKGLTLEESVRRTCERLRGSYALGIICAETPEKLIGVRKESPLVVGAGKGEMFIASDIPALLDHARKFIPLEDGEMAVLTAEGYRIFDMKSGRAVKRYPMTVSWTAEMAEKHGFPHFTVKEIYEQPTAIRETLRDPSGAKKLAGMMLRSRRTYFVACGTSYHAALVGKYALAKLADVPVEAVISSEFKESCRPGRGDLLLAITQSGETADTLSAVRFAKENGARIACLTNVVGSSITRESDAVCYTHAGPEVSVVATKTFSAQTAFLLHLSAEAARLKGLRKEADALTAGLKKVPNLVGKTINSCENRVRRMAEKHCGADHIYLIGRGIGYPIVMEGALKLKEITYIHSEAMPAGELKHGTLALIDRGTPVIAVVPPGENRTRMINNIEEVKARGATVIAISGGDDDIKEHIDESILIPPTEELFSPFLYIIPLQLLAYHMTVKRGQDPDRPRSLAKSVTVE